jgi:hypothetical protein
MPSILDIINQPYTLQDIRMWVAVPWHYWERYCPDDGRVRAAHDALDEYVHDRTPGNEAILRATMPPLEDSRDMADRARAEIEASTGKSGLWSVAGVAYIYANTLYWTCDLALGWDKGKGEVTSKSADDIERLMKAASDYDGLLAHFGEPNSC